MTLRFTGGSPGCRGSLKSADLACATFQESESQKNLMEFRESKSRNDLLQCYEMLQEYSNNCLRGDCDSGVGGAEESLPRGRKEGVHPVPRGSLGVLASLPRPKNITKKKTCVFALMPRKPHKNKMFLQISTENHYETHCFETMDRLWTEKHYKPQSC